MKTAHIIFTFGLSGILLGLLLTGLRHIDFNSHASRPASDMHQANHSAADDALAILNDTATLQELTAHLSAFPEHAKHERIIRMRQRIFMDPMQVMKAGIDLDSILLINPCYIPLYKVIDYHNQQQFYYHDLFNDSITDSLFKNRYMVAEFNTVIKDSLTKGVNEIHPELQYLSEIHALTDIADSLHITLDSLGSMDETAFAGLVDSRSDRYRLLYEYQLLSNYLEKVQRFKTKPIQKKHNYIWRYEYHTGQHICMCEAGDDTITLVARFATSAKAWTKPYNRHLPIGRSRYYYAPVYQIGSKNWEWGRNYTDFEAQRDALQGGRGSSYVTLYENKVPLPNFMLLVPDTLKYRHAMMQNGIHTQALPYLMGGMLGTPNSMGCWRVTDYASKFIRWWTPAYTKVFVYYTDENYFRVKTLDYTPEQKDSLL